MIQEIQKRKARRTDVVTQLIEAVSQIRRVYEVECDR
jgi:hypothetical protein